MSPEVVDDPQHHRFVLEDDGATAELLYDLQPGRLVILHTGVPDELGGRGVGGRLVRAAVGRAAADGLTVAPWCPFARRWLRGHEDAAASVTIDWSPPPASD